MIPETGWARSKKLQTELGRVVECKKAGSAIKFRPMQGSNARGLLFSVQAVISSR